jgi:hypothetical protein
MRTERDLNRRIGQRRGGEEKEGEEADHGAAGARFRKVGYEDKSGCTVLLGSGQMEGYSKEEPMTATRSFLSLGAVLTVFTGMAQPVPPAMEEPKRAEQQLQESQVPLTRARIRQARVDGKSEVVVAECRKILRYYEAQLKSVLEHKGMLCSEGPLREAEGAIAITRVWLAEAENKREDLAAELPKVISYHEWRIESHRSLHKAGVISDQDLEEAVKKSETALKWTKQRLTGLRTASLPQGKTENSAPGVP